MLTFHLFDLFSSFRNISLLFVINKGTKMRGERSTGLVFPDRHLLDFVDTVANPLRLDVVSNK